jgi:hypothetical protein
MLSIQHVIRNATDSCLYALQSLRCIRFERATDSQPPVWLSFLRLPLASILAAPARYTAFVCAVSHRCRRWHCEWLDASASRKSSSGGRAKLLALHSAAIQDREPASQLLLAGARGERDQRFNSNCTIPVEELHCLSVRGACRGGACRTRRGGESCMYMHVRLQMQQHHALSSRSYHAASRV